jgi:hypothetical protein
VPKTFRALAPWVACAAGLCLVFILLQPRARVSDIDSIQYLIGARNLRAGAGYRDFTGLALSRWWPPAYSFGLSLFQSPLEAIPLLHGVAFAATGTLLLALLLSAGWAAPAAASLVLALSFGFLRGIAGVAKPDILTYALFLLAALAWSRGAKRWAYVLWAALLPLKLIAVLFVPAFLAADSDRRRNAGVAVAAWSLALTAVLTFNAHNGGDPLTSHSGDALSALPLEIARFFKSVFRSGIAHWTGTLREPLALASFLAALSSGLMALLSLRRGKHRAAFAAGATLLAGSVLLRAVRSFDLDVRLLGYGLLMLCVGLAPRGGKRRWLAYGALSLIAGTLNALTVSDLGVNEPQFERLAREVRDEGLPEGRLFTNAFRLLEVHQGVPTQTTTDLSQLGPEDHFLWVGLDPRSAVTKVVSPMERPGESWCAVRSFTRAGWFRRCGAPRPAQVARHGAGLLE